MWVQDYHHRLDLGCCFAVHLLSIWESFVLREITERVSCSDPDKANCVPVACAFELWGEKKKAACNSGPCGIACCRRCMWTGYRESDPSLNEDAAQKPNIHRMSWSMSAQCHVLGQANVTHFSKGRCFWRYWMPFLLPQEMCCKDMLLRLKMKRSKETMEAKKGSFQINILMRSIL